MSEKGIKAGAWGRVDFTVKEGRFQGGKGGQARRVSLGDIKGSMSR